MLFFISMLIFRGNHFWTNVTTDCTAVGCKTRFSIFGSMLCTATHMLTFLCIFSPPKPVRFWVLVTNEYVYLRWQQSRDWKYYDQCWIQKDLARFQVLFSNCLKKASQTKNYVVNSILKLIWISSHQNKFIDLTKKSSLLHLTVSISLHTYWMSLQNGSHYSYFFVKSKIFVFYFFNIFIMFSKILFFVANFKVNNFDPFSEIIWCFIQFQMSSNLIWMHLLRFTPAVLNLGYEYHWGYASHSRAVFLKLGVATHLGVAKILQCVAKIVILSQYIRMSSMFRMSQLQRSHWLSHKTIYSRDA